MPRGDQPARAVCISPGSGYGSRSPRTMSSPNLATDEPEGPQQDDWRQMLELWSRLNTTGAGAPCRELAKEVPQLRSLPRGESSPVQRDYVALIRWLETPKPDGPGRADPDYVTHDELLQAFFYVGHTVSAAPTDNFPSRRRAKSQRTITRTRIFSMTRGGYERQIQRNASIFDLPQHVMHTYDTVPRRRGSLMNASFLAASDSFTEEEDRVPLSVPYYKSIDGEGFQTPRGEDDGDEDDDQSESSVFMMRMFGGFSLLVGVLSMSCIGSVASQFAFPSDGGPAVNGMLLGCWIAQALHVIFVAVSIFVVWRQGPEQRKKLRWLLTSRGILVTVIAGCFSGLGSGCWTLSFGLTSVPQAYLFNAFPPTVIMIFRSIAGLPPFWDERLGVLVGVVGAFLVLLGSAEGESQSPNPLLGDCLAFISSVSNAICVMSGKFAANEVPTTVYLSCVTLGSALVQFLFCAAFVSSDNLLSADPNEGVLGWASDRWFQLFACLAGAFTLGQWGMFAALSVVPALGVSMVLTAQPIVATIMGVAVLRTEQSWPAPLAIAGGMLIVVGSLFVVYSSSKHEMEEPEKDVWEGSDSDGPGVGAPGMR
eukprot:TRINITY_DN8646_c0_g1_i1.p1 TRINITY_DN8646_c0_g1~~TRINITY_DN8646_c0_g1_i1.p1  ORF type:complete len:618 (+),score=170.24 TRINITY_DN8646_c0_g1_i1:72-1856(+)